MRPNFAHFLHKFIASNYSGFLLYNFMKNGGGRQRKTRINNKKYINKLVEDRDAAK